MKQKALVDINGIKYMSVKAAGNLWNMSSQKVAAACKDERVVGATKDSSNRYIIPVDSHKPLEKEMIRMTLIALLAMKNNPSMVLSDEYNSSELFAYLKGIDLVDGERLITAVLTDKGMKIATSGKTIDIDWMNSATTIIGIIGSLASIWGVIPK